MKKYTKHILKYVLEFLIVTFGVFLGMYVNELQNDKKIHREKEKSIHHIVLELENNKKNVEEAITYHQSIKTEIDSIVQTIVKEDLFKTYVGNTIFRYNRIKGWNGVQLANLESIALDGAKISGIIKEYDIEIIKSISKVYSLQEDYSEFGVSIRNKMINLNASTKIIDVLGAIQLMTTDLLVYEKKLLNEISKAQVEIKTS